MRPDEGTDLFPHSGNPLPRNAKVHTVTASDGTRLRALTAIPENPKGTVIVLGGRADFMERYFETIRDLMRRGFAVVTFDWRGQGGSQRLHRDPLRGHGGNFKTYDDDLEQVMLQLVSDRLPRPYVALAHSTGGTILLRNLRKPGWFSKAVITSPLLDFIYGAWPRGVAKLLGACATAAGLGWIYLPGYGHGPMQRNEFPINRLTSDPDRWDRDITTLEKSPQLGVGGPTFSWFMGALASMERLRQWPRKSPIACPVLIIASGNEQVVDPNAARQFSKTVSGISYLQIAGSKHEILMEQDKYRAQFWAAFDSFINQ